MPRSDSTERHLNLLFVLLNASRPLSRETIRDRVPGYNRDNDATFQRMFERDKEDLREMNIPLETVPMDAVHDDAHGYWINRKTWLLPELKLTNEDRALITLAARVWDDEQMSAVAREAAGRVGDLINVGQLPEARMAGHNLASTQLIEAATARKQVRFQYSSKKSGTTDVRIVEPWRIFCSASVWYVVGFDADKGERRIFRLSRIIGAVDILDQTSQEPIPTDLDVDELVAQWREVEVIVSHAQLKVQSNTCAHLRTLADSIDYGDEYDTLHINFVSENQLATSIAAVCDLVTIIEPKTLVNAVTSIIDATLMGNQ